MTMASLDDALTVIRRAALLGGDLKAATSWYLNDRISIFDGLTAEALVQQGRTLAVLRYIQTPEAGFAG